MATPTQKRMVTGMFRDRDSAEQAYRSVTDRGYGAKDVNLVMSDDTRKRHFAEQARSRLSSARRRRRAPASAAPSGGTIGAIAGSARGGRHRHRNSRPRHRHRRPDRGGSRRRGRGRGGGHAGRRADRLGHSGRAREAL